MFCTGTRRGKNRQIARLCPPKNKRTERWRESRDGEEMDLIISVLAAFHTAQELEYQHPSTAAAKHSGARPEQQYQFENGSGALTRQRHTYKFQHVPPPLSLLRPSKSVRAQPGSTPHRATGSGEGMHRSGGVSELARVYSLL